MIPFVSRLPLVRGRYVVDADLKPYLWFRVGGKAQVLFKPADRDDLQHFLQQVPEDVLWYIIGAGSNVLVRDGGIPGVVIRLGKGFNHIKVQGYDLSIGGAALDRTVALECMEHGIGGLEFLAGIPGTIGGAVKMNAGAYGTEVKDRIVSCTLVDCKGNISVQKAEDLMFSYRHSNIADDCIVIEATFRGIPEEKEVIADRLRTIMTAREETQPVRSKTGGSTFKNPPSKKAWELIDQAQCRGLTLGGAQVSTQHCNFLINTGNATAADLENLGEKIQQKVLEKSGIMLEWEIKRLGIKKQ